MICNTDHIVHCGSAIQCCRESFFFMVDGR